MRLLVTLVPILLATGCASNVPRAIQEAPAGNPTVSEVRDDIDRLPGTRVRWGGTIASVENRRERDLDRGGCARSSADTGRPEGSDYALADS
ncbi:MAG: Slp family lipoprotein [Gammaproteobacteria bacterium]|nr:Slp family lipoprotein [Gammaproteobacteria bacterium]